MPTSARVASSVAAPISVKGVSVGAHSKVQNYALIYGPALLEDGVFIGPAAVLTNDKLPRSINPDGSLKSTEDWQAEGVTIRRGAAIGARALVLPGVEVGEWSMVGAGAVVTKDVPAHALVVGSPACQVGWVGIPGKRRPAKGPCDSRVTPGQKNRHHPAS